MRIVLDILLNDEGHELKCRCSKPYGMSITKFDPKKSMGGLVIAFEHFAEMTGFYDNNPDNEQVNMFKKWIKAEKEKYEVK